MIFIKPFARKLVKRLRAVADAHEGNAYNPNLFKTPGLNGVQLQNQHLTVAWALRSVAITIEEVIGDAV